VRRGGAAKALDLQDTNDALRARFWSWVDSSGGPDACWPWTGYRKPGGYGQFRLGDRNYVTSSRVACALTNGPIPDRYWACHTCDNPPCCNPSHIFIGTGSENAMDMVAKGRGVWARGEDHRDRVLDENAVRYIRSLTKRWGLWAELGVQYGVAANTIKKAYEGRSRKHVA
jgi:hypothetical protein